MKDIRLDGGVLVTGRSRHAELEVLQQHVPVGRLVGVPGRQVAPLPAGAGHAVAGQPRGAGLAAADHPGVGGVAGGGVGARDDGVEGLAVDVEVRVLGYGVGRAGCEGHGCTGVDGDALCEMTAVGSLMESVALRKVGLCCVQSGDAVKAGQRLLVVVVSRKGETLWNQQVRTGLGRSCRLERTNSILPKFCWTVPVFGGRMSRC